MVDFTHCEDSQNLGS